MSTPVKLPELGEGVTEGELIKWLVKVGDSVNADQTVAEVLTDKATVEVPTPTAGVVKSLLFKAGDIIKVESTILELDSTSATTQVKPAAKIAPTTPAPQPTLHATPVASPAAPRPTHSAAAPAGASFYPSVADSRVLATPSTRRLAREMAIDINQLHGSGLAGRVTREDVLGYNGGISQSPTPRQPSLGDERIPLRGIRKKIAENLQMAKHIIPHFTLMDEADVTELVRLRSSLKEYAEKNKTKITYLPFVMKALISTCRQFPMFNASIDDTAAEIIYKKYYNVGFAADTPNGLVVPVIKNADQKSILTLSKEIVDLSQRARDGKLKPEEMKGATITITNIGSVGGTYATPIINHPEVAILGMYKIQDRLALLPDGKVTSHQMMNFTITADHRLIDGAVAAHFLKEFTGMIQQPARLMAEMA